MKEQRIRSFALGLVGGIILAAALIGLVQVELVRAQPKTETKSVAPIR